MSKQNPTQPPPQLEDNWDQDSNFDPSEYLTNETEAMEPGDEIHMTYQSPCVFQLSEEFDDFMVIASTVNNNEGSDLSPLHLFDAGSISALDWDQVVPQQR
uniref:Elf-1_N domain-containing protein n=1 Tax=Panagrellus redivivus TaxID=6233 RepID=A0A7E4W0B1_PANRE